ncbi:MAG: helix-turn-helix transcriptional regulator [Lachnospiraceae bacterium]|nr:helix-turn-helix transcriptional regulator [Lachnospiraceae bacterium]
MILCFDAALEFNYHWCGKFTSPNNDWIHITRSRDDYELMVVTDGTLYIADHAREYAVQKGEYLLMGPTPFQHGTRSGGCNFYWLHFGYHNEQQDHDTLTEADEYKPGHLLIPVTGTLSSLERIIILMKQLQDSDRRYKDATLNRYLCSALLSEIGAQSRHNANRDKQLKEQLYSDILDYISWHIQENLRIPDIAAHFGYNEKYLTTFFKKYAGITLKQHLLQTKMEVAKSSLSETTQPISQIAYSLGFSDAHNFSNAFHKITGLSPSEYRASYNKHNVFQK